MGSSAIRILRSGDQRTGQRYPLLLSSRQFAGPMTGSVRQPHLLQPVQGLLLRFLWGDASHQQGHRHVLNSRKLRKQIVKLPDKSEFPSSEFRCSFFREPSQTEFGEVYVTRRSAIKGSKDVQQGTLSGT